MSWKEERVEMLNHIPSKNTNLKRKQALLNRLKNMRNENVRKLRSDLKSEDMSKFTHEIVQILDKMHIKSDTDVKNIVRLSIPELVCSVETGMMCSWRFVLLYELKILYAMKETASDCVQSAHNVSEQLTGAFLRLPTVEKLGVLAYFVRNEETVDPRWIKEIRNEQMDDTTIEAYNAVARALKMEVREHEPPFVKAITAEENEFLFYEIPFPSASLEGMLSEIVYKEAVEACTSAVDLSDAYRLARYCDLIVLCRTPVDLNTLFLPCAARIAFYSKRKVAVGYQLRAELSKFAKDLSLIDQAHLSEAIEIAGRFHLAQRSTHKKMKEMIDKLSMRWMDASAIERMKIDSTLASVMRKKRTSVDFKRAFISIFHDKPGSRGWCVACNASASGLGCGSAGCRARTLLLGHLRMHKGLLILVFFKTWLFRDPQSEGEWIAYFGLQGEMCDILLRHVLITKDIALAHLLSVLAGDRHDFFPELSGTGVNVLLAYLENLPPEKKAVHAREMEATAEVKNFCWRNNIALGKPTRKAKPG
jgi:hypothetical protein